jgi:hypothetical protein
MHRKIHEAAVAALSLSCYTFLTGPRFYETNRA